MYRAYWGMQFNPFTKELEVKDAFDCTDYRESRKRMEYLKNVRGIGLFTGGPGKGKTFSTRSFVDSLNPNLYRHVYIPLTTVPSGDFYRQLASGLGLEPAYRKADNFRQIQGRMRDMCRGQKVTPVILIDEAQYLNKAVLSDIKILMNFDMDSRDYAVLILSGHPSLNETLSMGVHEALAQRIVINYSFQGLSSGEVAEYIRNRMSLCGVAGDVFAPGALEAAAGVCGGSIRRLNNLAHKALIIGCEKKAKAVESETIMSASDEIDLL